MISYVLETLGVGTIWVALVLLYTGRISGPRADLLADIAAALTAWDLYQWWKHGGGDGTRRRLRKWAERFTPVRRTAPQGA